MGKLEELGFEVVDVGISDIEYSKKIGDSRLFVRIDFKRNEITFGELWINNIFVWSAPLEVIKAAIEVLNTRKVLIDYERL